jgi:predicted helicase
VHIEPDEHYDWIGQRDSSFEKFTLIGKNKDSSETSIFSRYFNGFKTGRDAWCYDASADLLRHKLFNMVDFFNSEVSRLSGVEDREAAVELASNDASKISWNRSLKNDLRRSRRLEFNSDAPRKITYRPFLEQWGYVDRPLNDLVSIVDKASPSPTSENVFLMVSGIGSNKGFTTFLTKNVPDVQLLFNGQCFPLWSYVDHTTLSAGSLFEGLTEKLTKAHSITDAGLKHFQDAFPGETITKEDLFYYVYGLLHSEDYRAKYADNLSKELPRIPRVKPAADFWAFSRAGRALGELHVNYESVELYPVMIKQGDLRTAVIKDPEAFYRVTKMKFGGKRGEVDKTTVIYNDNITMQNIPLEAYDYVVNGKPAVEWVMERQVVKTDKDSGIVNDANRYAIETVGNPAYPLELFQRVITVSLETMKIVRSLPPLDID